MKRLVVVFGTACVIAGCADWSPERKQEFWKNFAAGANAYNAGVEQYKREHPQVNCTSNTIGDTVYTHCQ